MASDSSSIRPWLASDNQITVSNSEKIILNLKFNTKNPIKCEGKADIFSDIKKKTRESLFPLYPNMVPSMVNPY